MTKKQPSFIKKTETFLERIIFESRWILLPLYLGLIVGLGAFVIHFLREIFEFSYLSLTYEKNDALIAMLTFVDKVLVGGLVIMVIIGAFENTVSRLNISDSERRISWLGKLDTSSLKVKLATSVVSISSVHLLKMFLEIDKYEEKTIIWTTVIHFVMVLTALTLNYVDKVSNNDK